MSIHLVIEAVTFEPNAYTYKVAAKVRSINILSPHGANFDTLPFIATTRCYLPAVSIVIVAILWSKFNPKCQCYVGVSKSVVRPAGYHMQRYFRIICIYL